MEWLRVGAAAAAQKGQGVGRTVSKESTDSTIGDGAQAATETASASGASGGGGSASVSMSVSFSGGEQPLQGGVKEEEEEAVQLGLPRARESDGQGIGDASTDDVYYGDELEDDYDIGLDYNIGIDNASLAAQEALFILQTSSLSMTTEQQRDLVEELKRLANLVESNLLGGGTMPSVKATPREAGAMTARAPTAEKAAEDFLHSSRSAPPSNKIDAALAAAAPAAGKRAAERQEKDGVWHFPSIRMAEEEVADEIVTVIDWDIPGRSEDLRDILSDWSPADLVWALELCKTPYKYDIGHKEVILGLSRLLSREDLRRTEVIARCSMCSKFRPRRTVRLVPGLAGQRRCEECRRKAAENPSVEAAAAAAATATPLANQASGPCQQQMYAGRNGAFQDYMLQQQEAKASKASLSVSQQAPNYWQPWTTGNEAAAAASAEQLGRQMLSVACPNPGCGGVGYCEAGSSMGYCYTCNNQWEVPQVTPSMVQPATMVQTAPTMHTAPTTGPYYEMPTGIPMVGLAPVHTTAPRTAPVVPRIQIPTAAAAAAAAPSQAPVVDTETVRNILRARTNPDYATLFDVLTTSKMGGQPVSGRLPEFFAAAASMPQIQGAPWERLRGLAPKQQQRLWLLMQQNELNQFTAQQQAMLEQLQKKEGELKLLLEVQRREGTAAQDGGRMKTFLLELGLREHELVKERVRFEGARRTFEHAAQRREAGSVPTAAAKAAAAATLSAAAAAQTAKNQEVKQRQNMPRPDQAWRQEIVIGAPFSASREVRSGLERAATAPKRGDLSQLHGGRETTRRDTPASQPWQSQQSASAVAVAAAAAAAAAAATAASPVEATTSPAAEDLRKRLREGMQQQPCQQEVQRQHQSGSLLLEPTTPCLREETSASQPRQQQQHMQEHEQSSGSAVVQGGVKEPQAEEIEAVKGQRQQVDDETDLGKDDEERSKEIGSETPTHSTAFVWDASHSKWQTGSSYKKSFTPYIGSAPASTRESAVGPSDGTARTAGKEEAGIVVPTFSSVEQEDGPKPQAKAAVKPIQVSRGSAYHDAQLCKPCMWFWKPQGCRNGRLCEHCHLCDADASRQVRALRRER